MLDVFSMETAIRSDSDYIKMSVEDMMQTLFMSTPEERQIKTADTVGKSRAEGRNLSS